MDHLKAVEKEIEKVLHENPDFLQQIEDGQFANESTASVVQSLKDIIELLHPADTADILERLPLINRVAVWKVIPPTLYGDILVELEDSVRGGLIAETNDIDMTSGFSKMSVEDIAFILRELPIPTRARLMRLAGLVDDPDLRASLSFGEETVGEAMDFQAITVSDQETVGSACEILRQAGNLPSHCDKLFVVDARGRLNGVLLIKRLLTNMPSVKISSVMTTENLRTFRVTDSLEYAANAFERYDLISAPVLDATKQIIGRITIDEIVDHFRSEGSKDILATAGLIDEEDLFAPLLQRIKNRWLWISVSLFAAFLISKVVNVFEGTIERVIALASLMPIVTGMGGNAGNQTSALVIRALALGHITKSNWSSMICREIALGLINGFVWGGLVGLFAYGLYGDYLMAIILTSSMVIVFGFSALVGFGSPLLMEKLGRDPALGATIVLTTITDCIGFLVFLGLSTLILL